MMASELAPGQAKSGKELYLMYDKIHYKKKKKRAVSWKQESNHDGRNFCLLNTSTLNSAWYRLGKQ